MSKILLFIGPSGSRKSTEAVKIINRDKTYFRINRDDMRRQLIGKLDSNYYNRPDFKNIERLVSDILHEQTLTLLNSGYNIIMDNTHLQKEYVYDIIRNYNHLADIEIKFFKVEFDEAVIGLKNREGSEYDTKYLKNQYKDYEVVYKEFKNNIFYPKQDTKYYTFGNLPKVMIFDLDGTLSLFDKEVRSPYDRDFENDDVNMPLMLLIHKALEEGIKLFLFSGRNEKARSQTVDFLENKVLLSADKYELIMRKDGDFRKDHIVKNEFFDNHIRDKYEVLFAADDRLQVIEGVWNKLGIHCLNVNQGNKRF